MRLLTIGLAAAALAACASPGDVVRTGPDSYRIRPTAATAQLNEADYKAYAVRRAGEYCAGEGKRTVVTVAASAEWISLSGRESAVRFVCDTRSPLAAATHASAP